jgi:hypothetical protein
MIQDTKGYCTSVSLLALLCVLCTFSHLIVPFDSSVLFCWCAAKQEERRTRRGGEGCEKKNAFPLISHTFDLTLSDLGKAATERIPLLASPRCRHAVV